MPISPTLLLVLLSTLVLLALAAVVQLVLLHRRLSKAKGDDPAAVVREEIRASRVEAADAASSLRKEIADTQKNNSETLLTAVKDLGKLQQESMNAVEKRVKELTDSSTGRLDRVRETVDNQLTQLRQSNETKLEQMRTTVDEKLQSTLKQRLGESFKQVSEGLEAVHKDLGEMRSLATDVGGLKRVLANVRERGTLGEYQLGNILADILTPEQYRQNVAPKPNSQERVEYAVKLPGKDDDAAVWLPIDAKFPQADYHRLQDASKAGDAEGVTKATDALKRTIRNAAADISRKYLAPPHTTDFAIMFLPTEGLYAEIIRQPDLVGSLQQTHRVVVAGPTTLAALLNALRMGFRTLAVEKRSSEVWKTLGAAKTQFGKFGGMVEKAQKHLRQASDTLGDTGRRTRAVDRVLRDVEALPDDQAAGLLELDEESVPALEPPEAPADGQ